MAETLAFLRHCVRAFVNGLAWLGAFSQHNLIVGGGLVALLVFPSLGVGVFGLVVGQVAVYAPMLLLSAFIPFLVFAVGSYRISPRSRETLRLDVRYGILGCNDPPKEMWERAAPEGVVYSDDVRVWTIGDMLIVNRSPHRVILRLRIRIPNAEDEFAFASAICVRGQAGMYPASDAGSVPHLPTEIVLGEDEHVRGHTEFVADAQYLDRHYSKWRDEMGEIEVEELLSGRVSAYPRETTPSI